MKVEFIKNYKNQIITGVISFTASLTLCLAFAYTKNKVKFEALGYFVVNKNLAYATFSQYKNFFKNEDVAEIAAKNLLNDGIKHENGKEITTKEIISYVYSQNRDTEYEVVLVIKTEEESLPIYICNSLMNGANDYFQTYSNVDYKNNLKELVFPKTYSVVRENKKYMYAISPIIAIGFSCFGVMTQYLVAKKLKEAKDKAKK